MKTITGKPNARSQDFRYVYANTFGVIFGPAEVTLYCGIQENPGSNDTTMEEQAAVVINHSAAKILAQMLELLIEDYEEAMGTPIVVPADKLDPLKTQIAAVKAAREKAKQPKA